MYGEELKDGGGLQNLKYEDFVAESGIKHELLHVLSDYNEVINFLYRSDNEKGNRNARNFSSEK